MVLRKDLDDWLDEVIIAIVNARTPMPITVENVDSSISLYQDRFIVGNRDKWHAFFIVRDRHNRLELVRESVSRLRSAGRLSIKKFDVSLSSGDTEIRHLLVPTNILEALAAIVDEESEYEGF